LSQLVSYLFRFCAEHRLEKKNLIVPSYQVGHQIGELLAKEAGAWVNLHFVTLPSLAQEAAGIDLSKQGIALASQTKAFFLVDRVFRRLKAAQKLEYFGQIEATTGIVRAVRHSIFALRMAGLKSRDLNPASFISKTKGEEIILMLQEYEEELAKEKLIDLPGLYIAALEELNKTRQRKAQDSEKESYLWLQGRPSEYLESQFLKKLAGGNLVLVPRDPIYGLQEPRRFERFASSAGEAFATPSPTTDVERLPWLFSPKDAPLPFRDNTLAIFSAIGPTNECREILRRIVTEKIPLDDIEIITPPGPTYPSLIFALSAKAGLPTTFAEGIPPAFTSPGKVFNGLVEWLEHDYLVSDLCALIEAGSLKLPSGNGHAALTPLKASRYLRGAMIGWGRERYLARLKTLVENIKSSSESAELESDEEGGAAEDAGRSAEERLDKAERQIKEVESLLALVKELLELVPVEDENGKLDFGALCRGAAAFIGKFARLYGELDGEARTLLESKLEEAAAFKTAPLRRQVAFEWLKNVAAGVRVGASGPEPGHLHLSNWQGGGYSGRPLTFVVGLDQGAFPGAGIQDPILLDEERERLSVSLRTTSDSLRENLWGMAGMLARLRGRVTLSYSAYDIIEERQSFPSSIILQAVRLVSGKPELDYSALAALLPEARAFLPGEREKAVDEVDWWLGRLAAGGKLRDGLEAVKANFDSLGHGIFARERREKDRVSEYEGKIKIDPREVHPGHNQDIVMSASRLEALAKCPFGYLLRYVLEVQPPEELKLDQTRWLDAMQRGSLLHEIFARFMRELRQGGEGAKAARAGARVRVRAEKHASLIESVAEDVIARYKEEIPPPSGEIFKQERRQIEEALKVFLRAEEEWEGMCEPLLFEVSFGTGRRRRAGAGKRGEAAAEQGMEEPAILDLRGDGRISIAGRIDRIDRVGDGRYRVIDYKTGSYSIYEDLVAFGEGRVLQYALYAIAAEQILKKLKIDARPVVVESGYYFPTRKGEGNKIFRKFDRKSFKNLVSEILGILEKGNFVANPRLGDIECEEYCDYAAICGGASAKDRAKAKKDRNPEVFGIFEKLKEYE